MTSLRLLMIEEAVPGQTQTSRISFVISTMRLFHKIPIDLAKARHFFFCLVVSIGWRCGWKFVT